jgi:hypothetical protein
MPVKLKNKKQNSVGPKGISLNIKVFLGIQAKNNTKNSQFTNILK